MERASVEFLARVHDFSRGCARAQEAIDDCTVSVGALYRRGKRVGSCLNDILHPTSRDIRANHEHHDVVGIQGVDGDD